MFPMFPKPFATLLRKKVVESISQDWRVIVLREFWSQGDKRFPGVTLLPLLTGTV